ncbi:MAG: SsrA-binding protein SmpB [Polyangiaceae bacterium]
MAAGKDKALFGDRVVALNRRARHEYDLGDAYEAGMQLIGSEVRALRVHGGDLSDAWVDITRDGQAVVKGMRIPTLDHAAFGHDETRPRKLLLHAYEIERLRATVERERMTIVATKCYFKNGRAKLEIALARGKKQYDKRQSLKERDAKREAYDAIREGKTRGGNR